MSWKQMLEVKPEVETAVDVATSGDPCCETAREKLIDLIFEHKIVIGKHGRKYSREETISKIRKEPCDKILAYLLQIQNNFSRTEPEKAKEANKILNEWVECEGEDLKYKLPVK